MNLWLHLWLVSIAIRIGSVNIVFRICPIGWHIPNRKNKIIA
jgi:hypothetical protein